MAMGTLSYRDIVVGKRTSNLNSCTTTTSTLAVLPTIVVTSPPPALQETKEENEDAAALGVVADNNTNENDVVRMRSVDETESQKQKQKKITRIMQLKSLYLVGSGETLCTIDFEQGSITYGRISKIISIFVKGVKTLHDQSWSHGNLLVDAALGTVRHTNTYPQTLVKLGLWSAGEPLTVSF